MPPGIAVSDGTPDGTLDGMPTAAGSYNFELIVVDSNGNADTASLSLTVTSGPPIRLKTFLHDNGRVGDAFSVEIEAADGAAGSPTFSVVPANGLPPGLTLTQPSGGSKTATISGMPTTAGHYRYALQVTDGVDTASHSYVTTIAIAPRWLVYRGDFTTSSFDELWAVDVSGASPGSPIALDPTKEVTDDFEYRFSWDGRWLFYIGNDSGVTTQGDLFAIDMSGATPGTPIQLNAPSVAGDLNAFQITPNDRWVVFAGDQDALAVDELYAVDISGGPPFPAPVKISTAMPVTGADVLDDDIDPTSYIPGLVYGSPSPSTFDGFAISPNGDWVAYRHDADVDNQIDVFLVDLSGSMPGAPQQASTRTRPAGTDAEEFCWSNDSQWLAITADWETALRDELFLINMSSIGSDVKVNAPLGAGTGLNVYTGVSYFSYYTFAPDVTSIVYRADDQVGSENNLFFVPIVQGVPGTAVQVNVSQTNSDVTGWVYSPDSRWLAYLSDERTPAEEELWVVDVAGGVLGSKQLVSHDPIALNGDVQSFSTTDRNVVWASDSEHLVFRADTLTNDEIEAFSVKVSAGMPFPTPERLNPPVVSGGDVATIWTIPDGETVGLVGDFVTDTSQNLYFAYLSNPGTVDLVSDMTAPSTSLEIADTADNDAGCFHSPDLKFIGIWGDQLISTQDELWLADVSGGAPFAAPIKINPTAASTAQDVFSFQFSR